MKLKTAIAVLSCKILTVVLHALGFGGTSFPGYIALKFDKNLLRELSDNLQVIVVTGSNGKTTTCRILGEIFSEAGIKYFSNSTGANLLNGIATAFAGNAGVLKEKLYTHAIIECDEATLKKLSEFVHIKNVVITNILEDQVDRFGGRINTLNLLCEAISNMPDSGLVLNADCPFTADIANKVPNKTVWFGVGCPLTDKKAIEDQEKVKCIHCGAELKYVYKTFGQLGGYSCPDCGYSRPKADIEINRIIWEDNASSAVTVRIFDNEKNANISLPGEGNIYNAAAAAAAALSNNIDVNTAVRALSEVKSVFGRNEIIKVGSSDTCMMLIKNKVGCDLALHQIVESSGKCKIVLLLNDHYPDGRDISWIKEVDFESLAECGGKIARVIVGGVRANEMAKRLEDAGFKGVEIIKKYRRLLEEIGADETPTFIMPTYTAMIELRKALVKRGELSKLYE